MMIVNQPIDDPHRQDELVAVRSLAAIVFKNALWRAVVSLTNSFFL